MSRVVEVTPVCGIVGILARDASVPPDLLERATQSLAHRGPDDHGTVIVPAAGPVPMEIGLGNRRLAILDLSPPDSGNWIVHNGEVYNFCDVRTKLEKEGICFASQSDTEVVLKAYGSWGERCLHEFRGMFAFAIWDATRNRLFVARDPMGIKPLYYYQSEKHFLFASEVRTLLGTGLIARRLDEAGVLSYLTFGSAYEPSTLLEGISALPPGHYLTWENGKVTKQESWDLAGQQESPTRDLDAPHAAARFGRLEHGPWARGQSAFDRSSPCRTAHGFAGCLEAKRGEAEATSCGRTSRSSAREHRSAAKARLYVTV